ncbi:DEAD/DEAH box helicase [Apilactobacillus kunkeei]|uniref:DEAD/DEAH box helicase n=1 Tax=Apilactobacillus kunkeei TaxID=148814 RepID=UPI00110C8DA9|nr:helicase-related protein [Apilactobacillus kunkeei]TMT00643.1 DEAD/DEAH box helicase [Apilactobacillus kunkeei]
MIKDVSELYGRQINATMVDKSLLNKSMVHKYVPIKVNNNIIYCKRCGQKTPVNCCNLPNNNYYCPVCINLDRVTKSIPLVYADEPNNFEIKHPVLTWHGQLTDEQKKCSKDIINVFEKNKTHLLWAVTGAGKTEMLFQGIAKAITEGKRVCISSPRVDVCVELYPRIKEAFANTSIILLHGRNPQPYYYAQLTICTAHQLLRFYHAFDVLIIDEVDSFPFVNNQGLHFAVENATKKNSAKLFLTATPTNEMTKKIKTNKLSVSYLPIRFHRHLLPEIKLKYAKKWRNNLKKRKLPRLLLHKIDEKIKSNQRFLLFVPRVADLKPISDILSKHFDNSKWETVFSSDDRRMEKVSDMRERRKQFLITTTILERGVTFPGIDVIVFGAEDEVFSTSSLVQIAGRVGRKIDRPTGEVLFLAEENTLAIQSAINQIKYMNKKAKKLNG